MFKHLKGSAVSESLEREREKTSEGTDLWMSNKKDVSVQLERSLFMLSRHGIYSFEPLGA